MFVKIFNIFLLRIILFFSFFSISVSAFAEICVIPYISCNSFYSFKNFSVATKSVPLSLCYLESNFGIRFNKNFSMEMKISKNSNIFFLHNFDIKLISFYFSKTILPLLSYFFFFTIQTSVDFFTHFNNKNLDFFFIKLENFFSNPFSKLNYGFGFNYIINHSIDFRVAFLKKESKVLTFIGFVYFF